jgi:hypothetical protein
MYKEAGLRVGLMSKRSHPKLKSTQCEIQDMTDKIL